MEKSERVFTIMADYEWSDVGNWVSVREMEGYSDDKDNVHLVDSENVFVKSNKDVGVVGVDGVVIIETENGILVAKEDRVNDIREVYRKIYK
jgi:mannose-1-phosphate guanylyltransferase